MYIQSTLDGAIRPPNFMVEERRGKVLTSDSIRWSTPSTLHCALPMTTNASKCMYAVRRDHTEIQEKKFTNFRACSAIANKIFCTGTNKVMQGENGGKADESEIS